MCPEANKMDNKQSKKKAEQHIVATLNVKIKNLLIKTHTERHGNPFKLKPS
jgi:hypothetical protein